jgi:hypothetical protein
MEVTIFTFTEEPSGQLYRALLDACVEHCQGGLLVERPSIGLSEQGTLVLERLRPWIQEEKQLGEWPGTKLHGHTALVRFFAFNPESAIVLKESAKALYDWQQPALPEDLCLLRPDGEPWLVSIAHERDGYLKISEEERDRFVKQLPGLAAILRYT